MKVTLSGIADAATVSPDGKVNILGVFDTIHVHQFPSTHPHCSYFARLAFEADDPRQSEVMLRAVDADGQLAAPPIAFKLEIPLNTPGELIFVPLAIDLVAAKFDAPGDYVFELAVNGVRPT